MLLRLQEVSAQYGAVEALKDLSLDVGEGELVSLIGANGAGKTTTIRAISGLCHVSAGDIQLDGRSIRKLSTSARVSSGISQSPEGRMVFPTLSVDENLSMGAYRRSDDDIEGDRAKVYELFPALLQKKSQPAGFLSGGQQQMLAIGRALMARPRLLLLDEPSMGVAPLLVKEIFQKIVELRKSRGLSILLVEQNAQLALSVSDRAYVLEAGRLFLEGPSKVLAKNPTIRSAYLGL
jgi:branched-chain amino acid transport system ATP-binding protein